MIVNFCTAAAIVLSSTAAAQEVDWTRQLETTFSDHLGRALKAKTLRLEGLGDLQAMSSSPDFLADLSRAHTAALGIPRITGSLAMNSPLLDSARKHFSDKGIDLEKAVGQRVFFSDQPTEYLGLTKVIHLDAELAFEMTGANDQARELVVAGDVANFLLGLYQAALGVKNIIVVRKTVIDALKEGGRTAELASSVLVHEFEHALQNNPPQRLEASRQIDPRAALAYRNLLKDSKEYFETQTYRDDLNRQTDASLKLAPLYKREALTTLLDQDMKNPANLRLHTAVFFSVSEWGAYQAQFDFLRKRKFSDEEILDWIYGASYTAPTIQEGQLSVIVNAPFIWILLKYTK